MRRVAASSNGEDVAADRPIADMVNAQPGRRKLSSGITQELRVHSFAYVNHEGVFRFRVLALAFGRVNCFCCSMEL